MALPRIIPVLTLRNKGLVKTVRFREHRYVGDPMNAVRIFNEKEVDELILADIDASREGREPDYDFIREIATECFSPIAYAGGVTTTTQIKRLIQSGVEKIVINTGAIANPKFISEAVENFGSSTIVGAIDVNKNMFGKYGVYYQGGSKGAGKDPVAWAVELVKLGVGEIFVNSIDRDGTMSGYDHALIKRVTSAVDVSVIACGGARDLDDCVQVIRESGASAAAAGSLFVFHGKQRAVLITYPEYKTIREKLQ